MNQNNDKNLHDQVCLWQSLYFKLLHVDEMIENHQWTEFFSEYEKYSNLFGKLDFDIEPANEITFQLTQKISSLQKMIMQKIKVEMDKSLGHIGHVKTHHAYDGNHGES